MKKLILLAFSLVSIAVTAQENEINKMFKNYEKRNFVRVIEVAPEMMGMAGLTLLEDMEELSPIIKHVKSMKFIAFEEDKENNFNIRKDSIYNNFTTVLERSKYKNLMNIRDGEEKIKTFSMPLEGGKMKDFVIAIQEEDEVVFIYLEGLFNNKDVSKILLLD